MAQPFVISMKFNTDATDVKRATSEIRSEFDSVGTTLDASSAKVVAFNREVQLSAGAIQSLASQQQRLAAYSAAGINSSLGIRDDFNTAGRAADIAAYGEGMDALRAKFNPLFALEQRHAVNIGEINRAQKLGALSAREMAAAVQMETDAFNRSVAAINNSGEALQHRNQTMTAGGGQFNTANVAAQFQDIAVTSAMGMSPMQIALQQGTQISAAFGNAGAAGAVKMLGGAFMSIISPVSLLTIGLVGGTAAAIQFFAGMADGGEQSVAALEKHSKWLDNLLVGYDGVRDRAQEAADQALRLPSASVALELGNNRIEVEKQLRSELDKIYNAPLHMVVNVQPQLADEIGEIQQLVDDLASGNIELGEFDTKLRLIKFSEEPGLRIRGVVDQLLEGSVAAQKFQGNLEGAVAAVNAMSIDSIIGASFTQLSSSADAIEALKAMTPDLRTPKQRAQAVYDANSGADANGDIQRQLAYTLGQFDAQEAEQSARKLARSADTVGAYDRQIKSIRERTAVQMAETNVIGLGTYASERALMVLDLENAAREDAIGLSVGRAAQIQEEASAYALAAAAQEKATDAQRLATEQVQFGRGTFGSFISDLKSGLKDGADGWDALGNAGANALDKIGDRALGMMADGIFDAIFGAVVGGITGGGGGNPLSLGAGGAGFLGGGAASWGSFDTGGWTGGVAGQARGVVHGEEFVVRAGPAAQHRQALEAINSGGSPFGGGGSITNNYNNTVNAQGSRVSRSEIEALLDARDRRNADMLPTMLADARHRSARGTG